MSMNLYQTLSVPALAVMVSACNIDSINDSSQIDTIAPILTINPNAIVLDSAQKAVIELTATDDQSTDLSVVVDCGEGGSFDLATGIYTAPITLETLNTQCVATATDDAGNVGEATLSVTVNVAEEKDTTAPIITFSPNAIVIDSAQTAAIELTITDDQSTDLSVAVACGENGSFDLATGIYTAPITLETLNTQCVATATDDAGNVGEATLSVTVNAAVEEDTIAPTVAFEPNTITLVSSERVATQLIFSDDTDTDLSATVNCSQGGAFSENEFTAPQTELSLTITCLATVTDNANNSTSATLNAKVIGSALAAININPFELDNYANQAIPAYISKDNTDGNPITDIGATLGRVLFYDTQLSTNNTISCSSCHQQENGFSDLANVSEGVNGVTGRHSMRLINARFSDETKFFWDERAETLEAQTTMPIQDFAEMGYSGEDGAPDFDDLIEKLSNLDYYQDLFTLTFGDADITESRMQKALAQFVRSIQSFDSRYDEGRAEAGNDHDDFINFSAEENLGKTLFLQNFAWEDQTNRVRLSLGEDPTLGELDVVTNPDGSETTYITYKVAGRTEGGFNCASCHVPPEFSIDPNSGNNAFVRPASNNPGAPSDINNTRAPTLRDLIKDINANDFDVTGIMPFNGGLFHSGQAHFLEDIFGHYEFRRYDPIDNPNLDSRMTRVSLNTGETVGLLLNSTRAERQAVSAFIFTLTGSDVYTNPKWSDPFQ